MASSGFSVAMKVVVILAMSRSTLLAMSCKMLAKTWRNWATFFIDQSVKALSQVSAQLLLVRSFRLQLRSILIFGELG